MKHSPCLPPITTGRTRSNDALPPARLAGTEAAARARGGVSKRRCRALYRPDSSELPRSYTLRY